MIKNYFVLDLSNLSASDAEEYFFNHLHLDSVGSYFEILTTQPELLTPLIRKYHLQGCFEITPMYIDRPSTNYYSNSIDKAYFKKFHYIAFFNQNNLSESFLPSQIEVPARVYYSKRIDSNSNPHSSVFTINKGRISYKTALSTHDVFAGVPFYGTFYPVVEFTAFSNMIHEMFCQLEHSDLVGLIISQKLDLAQTRPVFVPENITLCLQQEPKGMYKVLPSNQPKLKKISALRSLAIHASSAFTRTKKQPQILQEVYN